MEDYARARTHMVESQVCPNDVTDHSLISALLDVPRERFVPASRRPIAYIDEDLALETAPETEETRYLMEPMVFAKLVQLAEIEPGDLVLDVGCATGYSSAVLAQLADAVVGLESDPVLAGAANETLPELEIGNVAVVTGPLQDGYPSEGPYDVILIEGAIEEAPQALLGQLKDGGRLVAVVADGHSSHARLFRRNGERVTARSAFNAWVKPLPGFKKPAAFVF